MTSNRTLVAQAPNGIWWRAMAMRLGNIAAVLVIVFSAVTSYETEAAPLPLRGNEQAAFETANKLYEQGKYRDAAAAYRSLLGPGMIAPNAWFNLGNALFKSGELGQAISAYLRAERLTPRDPDLRANLSFAREQARGPTPPGGYWQSYLGRLTLNEWTLAAAAPFWLAVLLLSLVQWNPTLWASLRGWVFGGFAAALFLACCTAVAYQQQNTRIAVITADVVDVRHGPLEESQSAFTLHDGAETLVLDEKDSWLRIRAGSKGTGWVPRHSTVVMP